MAPSSSSSSSLPSGGELLHVPVREVRVEVKVAGSHLEVCPKNFDKSFQWPKTKTVSPVVSQKGGMGGGEELLHHSPPIKRPFFSGGWGTKTRGISLLRVFCGKHGPLQDRGQGNVKRRGGNCVALVRKREKTIRVLRFGCQWKGFDYFLRTLSSYVAYVRMRFSCVPLP